MGVDLDDSDGWMDDAYLITSAFWANCAAGFSRLEMSWSIPGQIEAKDVRLGYGVFQRVSLVVRIDLQWAETAKPQKKR